MPDDHAIPAPDVVGVVATVERLDEASWRVTVSGELDAATATELADVIDPLAAEPNVSLVVNLADVTFMDSSGLRALVRAANAAKEQHGTLVLARASGAVTRLLEVTGLVEHFRADGAHD